MMVERFSVKGWDDDHIQFADPDGKWVHYSDYEALASENEQLRKERDEARKDVVDAWNAFGGTVAEDYSEARDLIHITGGTLAENVSILSKRADTLQRRVSELENVAEECARIAASFDREFSATSSLLGDVAAAISARFGKEADQ